MSTLTVNRPKIRHKMKVIIQDATWADKDEYYKVFDTMGHCVSKYTYPCGPLPTIGGMVSYNTFRGGLRITVHYDSVLSDEQINLLHQRLNAKEEELSHGHKTY